MSLDSDAAARRAGACARHGQPSSTMQASGYTARHRHAVHALAVAGDLGPSGSLPRDERCARDRLGARACGAGRALWPVLGSVWRPLCAPAGRHSLAPAVSAPPAPQASGPPAAASSWDAWAHPPGSSPSLPQGTGGWHPVVPTPPELTPASAPHL